VQKNIIIILEYSDEDISSSRSLTT